MYSGCHASWKRKLLEELAQAVLVFALVWVNFGIGSFQIYRAENSGGPMPGAGEKDHIQIIFLDQAHKMKVSECQTGARSPVSEKTILNVVPLSVALLAADYLAGRSLLRCPYLHSYIRILI